MKTNHPIKSIIVPYLQFGKKVPSLILQPLVENSIIHGAGMRTETTTIWIITEYDEKENRVKIRIIDDGMGMEQKNLRDFAGLSAVILMKRKR